MFFHRMHGREGYGFALLIAMDITPRNAAICTFLVPGLGHFLLGRPLRGILAMALCMGLFAAGYAILKDRLWFFAGYQRLRDYDGSPGTDPRFPRKLDTDRIFWKITWQITPNLRLLHSYHDDYFTARCAT